MRLEDYRSFQIPQTTGLSLLRVEIGTMVEILLHVFSWRVQIRVWCVQAFATGTTVHLPASMLGAFFVFEMSNFTRFEL
jgi:hypothetical protein